MNNKKITFFFIGFVFLILQLTCIQAPEASCSPRIKSYNQEKVFQAGAATSNVTPFLGGDVIVKEGELPAAHIHDELFARCLVLDDGEKRIAFVVVDNPVINRELFDEAKKIIQQETNLSVEHILMSVTHTHSYGVARGDGLPFNEYQKFLIRRIADVVRVAINNLEPARIGWGVGSMPQHVFIRRWKMKPGTPVPNPFGGKDKVRMNPRIGDPDLLEPAGRPDPEVSFISVQSTDGRPIALLANYSLHYVGGVPRGHVSADYFGVFADRIQELLKADRQDPPFVGIMSNGTSGDVNNINWRGPAESNPPYAKIQRVADDVAKEVLRVYNTVQHHDWVSLQSMQEELTLKIRKPDHHMIEYANMVLSKPDDSRIGPHGSEKFYAQRTLQMQEWPDEIDIILQVFRIGELGIAAIPFETFAETGLEIKAKSPFKPTFTISMANGSYGGWYLPTSEQHMLGGYETWLSISRVEIEASCKIVSKLLELFDRLK